MSDLENQMGLFELEGMSVGGGSIPPVQPEPPRPAERAHRAEAPEKGAAEKPSKRVEAGKTRPGKKGKVSKAAPPRVSGLVPEGDVRLTANIRQELHLKLKIASAYRRTTIGEIIEELVEKYL